MAISNEEVMKKLGDIESMVRILIRERSIPDAQNEISVEEAAELCAMSTKTLYNYLSSGKLNIPTKKVGNRTVLNREDVITWQAERTFRVVNRNGKRTKIAA